MSGEHDRAVLDSIFNPYLPLGEGISLSQPAVTEEEDEKEEDTPLTKEAKELELEGVKKADKGKLNEALQLLTKAIEVAPTRASPYNNRGQVYRLLKNNSDALADLTQAVTLSGGRGKVAVQALCQRALIHRLKGDDSAARDNFKAAADLGSDFAKQQLVQMNPYAAMCNQMLQQVFSKLNQPLQPDSVK